jgi:hypothetical protein
MTVLTDRRQTARKIHQCDLCRCSIQAGETYRVSTNVTVDHGLYRWKEHEDCARIGERMLREWDLPDGYRDDDLVEWLFGGYFDAAHFDADDERVRARIEARRQA